MTLTRRDLLVGAGAGAIGVAAGTSAGTADAVQAVDRVRAAAARRPFRPYTASSYFKLPVTGHRVNGSRTQAFHHFMKTFRAQARFRYPTISGVDGSDWGTAYAMGSQHDPVWRLTGSMDRQCEILKSRGFHAPDWFGSMLTGTHDSPFCVIDRASGYTVFGSGAHVVGNHLIHVSTAGITYHSSNGLTCFNPRSDDRRNFSGRGRIADAMVIRKDLMDFGLAHRTGLGHVLHLFMTETNSADGYCNPMVSCEEGLNGFGAEGERIALSRHIDLSKRGMSPAGMVIARTLQEHGAYFGDNAGKQSTFKAEQENRSRPIWHGLLNRDSLRGITWDDFVVLERPPHSGRRKHR
jgi:hypothetical protein